VAAYAAYEGVDLKTFLMRLDPILTTDQVGRVVVDLCRGNEGDNGERREYLLTGAGLKEIP
jgi:hypothetical protein